MSCPPPLPNNPMFQGFPHGVPPMPPFLIPIGIFYFFLAILSLISDRSFAISGGMPVPLVPPVCFDKSVFVILNHFVPFSGILTNGRHCSGRCCIDIRTTGEKSKPWYHLSTTRHAAHQYRVISSSNEYGIIYKES